MEEKKRLINGTHSRRDIVALGGLTFAAISPLASLLAGGSAPIKREVVKDFYGMHINNIASDPLWHPHTDFIDVGQRWMRTWDTYTSWKLINIAPNKFDWHRLDEVIDTGIRHGLKIMINLASAPDWATGLSTGQSQISAGVPTDDSWVSWIDAVTSRYSGKVQAYELWNEPNLRQYWQGNVQQLTHLCKLAVPIIKSRTPQATILTPCATGSGGVPYLAQLAAEGVLNLCDAVAVHPYAEKPEEIGPLVARYISAAAAVTERRLPFWGTEYGWARYHDRDGSVISSADKEIMSDELAVSYISRYMLCSAASGLAHSFFYTADSSPEMKAPLVDPATAKLTLAGIAHRKMAALLVGSQIGSVEETASHYRLEGLSSKGEKFLVAWCDNWETSVLSQDKLSILTAVDPLGVSINREYIKLSMTPSILTLR